MKVVLGLAAIFHLAGCISEPAGGTARIYAYNPYAPGSQPNPLAVEVGNATTQTGRTKGVAEGSVPVLPRLQAPPSNLHLPPPAVRKVDGPVWVCIHGLAFQLRAGQHGTETNASLILDAASGGLRLEAWTLEPAAYPTISRAAGTVEVPGLGTVEKFELIVPQPAGYPSLFYVFTRSDSLFRRWAVTAPSFRGSASDLEAVGGVKVGQEAAAICSAAD